MGPSSKGTGTNQKVLNGESWKEKIIIADYSAKDKISRNSYQNKLMIT